MNKYRVWMHTKPAPGVEYYEGYVDVYADDSESAVQAAKRKLVNGAFFDRISGSFVADRIEILSGRGLG